MQYGIEKKADPDEEEEDEDEEGFGASSKANDDDPVARKFFDVTTRLSGPLSSS